MNFIILKVNGIDVSNSSHDEVMSILNRSKQPVQVEILTKDNESTDKLTNQLEDAPISNKINNSTDLVRKLNKVDKQVQTDSKWLDDLVYQHSLKCQFESNEQTKLNNLSNQEFFYTNTGDSDDLYEVLDDSDFCIDEEDFIDENCDAFEYKELSWSKANSNESIGLVLDKLENDKQNLILKTEIVYIKEILNPILQSILRLGDQILEINGIAVTNLDDARSRLDNPITNEFNILFSRLNIEHDHKICEQRIKLRKQKVLWLKQNAIRNKNLIKTPNLDKNSFVIDNKLQNKDTEKDSGLGKQTDQESIYTQTCSSSNDYDVFNSAGKNESLRKSDSLNSLEKEILLLNKEMESIKFECEMLNRNFMLNNQKSSHVNIASTKTNQLTRQLSDLSNNVSTFNQIDQNQAIEKKESIKKWIKNGLNLKKEMNKLNENSIASNNRTDSHKSNEINKSNNRLSGSKTDGNLIKRSGSMISLNSTNYQNDYFVKMNKSQNKKALDCPSEHEYAVINYENTNSLINRLDNKLINKSTFTPPPLPPLNGIRKNSSSLDASEDNELKIATMYTNKANLRQTIYLQQQLLLQAIEKKQKKLQINSSERQSPSQSNHLSKTKQLPNDNKIENKTDTFKCKKIDKNKFLLNNTIIKLKRKSDGTRYISSKKLVNTEACKQKIINCNKNLINHNCNENQKFKKSKDNDYKLKENEFSKHLLKTKPIKKTNHPKFLNEKLEERLKKMKLQDNHLVLTNTDIFTVATV